MDNIYYKAPLDLYFDEVKMAAISIWKTYDNTHGYVDEKVEQLNKMINIRGNFMYIVAMFDSTNHKRLAELLTAEAKLEIRKRLIAGGATEEFVWF